MENQQNNKEGKTSKKTNFKFILVLALLIIFGAWFGISKYIHGKHHEETDDAQVESTISPVLPRVSGYVKEIRVKDNQVVKQGDTLVILDNRDELLKVKQAEAALASAEGNLGSAQATTDVAAVNINTVKASVGTIDAQIETAKVNQWRTTEDLKRYENLYNDHTITKQQYEQALAAKQTADRQLDVLYQQRKQAIEQTQSASSQRSATSRQINIANATIEQRKVEIENAKLNLSYTVVTAQSSGRVSKVNIQPGQYLQAGQSLFNIIPDANPWVVANFKETQLNKMKEGQKVTIKVDAFPDHEFEATVTSFSPATGGKLTLLPPDNASGNFVKVVQRLPVKIEFNANDTLVKKLRPGMNVDVDVHLD
jgi:membrane fusion protein, multidrug efflux system